MANDANNEKKKLCLETMHFLIAERNKALFRLNACIAAEKILKLETKIAKASVQNIRSRLLHEFEVAKDVLSAEEKRNFIDFYSSKEENEKDNDS